MPGRLLRAWYSGLSDHEKVLLSGLVLLAGGLTQVWAPAALLVPGMILVLVALGFTLERMGKS